MKYYALLIMLVLIGSVYADAGNNEGEIVLDSSTNYQTTSFRDGLETGLNFVPGGLLAVKAASVLTNTFSTQFTNKENGDSQNVELETAQQNLENSKDNVSMMFFFIVSTFVVVLDALISMLYISLFLMLIWIVFVGYAKILILVIRMISGKIQARRGTR